MIEYTPEEQTKSHTALQYLLFKLVKTDLTYGQSKKLVQELSKMDLKNNKEKIFIDMRPKYEVQDIEYDADKVKEHLDTTIGRVGSWLPEVDYSNLSKEEMQKQLLALIEDKKDDPDFISWSFENHLWLQIEDEEVREKKHFDILMNHVLPA